MDAILIAQRKQRLVWGAATLLIVLLGLTQRDQRSLLSSPAVTASAFAAIIPQSPGIAIAGGNGRPGQGGQSGFRRPTGRFNGGEAPQFANVTGTPLPGPGTAQSVFDPQTQPDTPSALSTLADPSSSNGINPGPGLDGSLPSISPAGPQQTVGGTAPGAVPEAPMWAIMILGVAGIGCMARRERTRGRSLLNAQIV